MLLMFESMYNSFIYSLKAFIEYLLGMRFCSRHCENNSKERAESPSWDHSRQTEYIHTKEIKHM